MGETDRKRAWEGEERKGDTESEAGSKFWAVSTEPTTEFELMNHENMTWAKVKHVTDWATKAPLFFIFYFKVLFIYFETKK